MKVLITGGAGTCGTALAELPFDTIFTDKNVKSILLANRTFVQADLTDYIKLKKMMIDVDVLVHLAAADYYPDFKMGSSGGWSDYLDNNIVSLKDIFDLAISSNIRKIIFASTHRVVGMYEKEYAPEIYKNNHNIMLDHLVPVRPDSLYSTTKLFGENLGRLLVDEGKCQFISLRICSVRSKDDDNPYAYAEQGVKQKLWERHDEKYMQQLNRLKGLWHSRKDFMHMIEKIILCENMGYDTFYGVSDNTTRWFDIEHAKKIIGYAPVDNSEYV